MIIIVINRRGVPRIGIRGEGSKVKYCDDSGVCHAIYSAGPHFAQQYYKVENIRLVLILYNYIW